jgi:integrase
MIQSRRFCRNTINKYTRRIVSIFTWGMEMKWVRPDTVFALKAVKFIPEGYAGTFDNDEREEVPDDVVLRTLPFMSPTVRTMVQVQRMTGMRPSEVFNMRVGDIDRTQENGLWYYIPKSHKTKKHIGKKRIPLGKPEQELIAPYLIGKEPESAVFSPRTAVMEHFSERRASRKTKVPPSQAAKSEARAATPSRYAEFYTKYTYRRAIMHAIQKGNRHLPDGEQIPHWFPYQLRHSAGTDAEKTLGLDGAQALLGHRTANTTKRYAHGQVAITESMARNRRNPFETKGGDV